MGAPCQDTVQDLDSASTAECALTACMQTNMFDDSMMIQQSTKACSARSMARPRAAALDTVSSYSASGTESATRPAPACMPKQLLTVELEMAGSIVCKLWLGLQTINVCSSCMQYDALLYYTGMIVSRLAGDTSPFLVLSLHLRLHSYIGLELHTHSLQQSSNDSTCRCTVHFFLALGSPLLLLPFELAGGGGLGMTMVRNARAMSMLPL